MLLVLLYFTARNFPRSTYRCTVLVVAVAGVISMTAYGGKGVHDLVDGFYRGTSTVIKAMVNWFVPVDNHTMPVAIAWIVLAAACAVVLLLFDTLSIHREQPRVEIPDSPGVKGADDADHRIAGRCHLMEEVRFRLPAVYVRRPATMPGGSKLDTLAAVAEKSGASYGQLTGAARRPWTPPAGPHHRAVGHAACEHADGREDHAAMVSSLAGHRSEIG